MPVLLQMDPKSKKGILPPPSGTYVGDKMMNLLKIKPKVVGPGIVDSGDITCSLKSGTPVTIPNNARISAAQLKQYYQLTVRKVAGGRISAELLKLPAKQ